MEIKFTENINEQTKQALTKFANHYVLQAFGKDDYIFDLVFYRSEIKEIKKVDLDANIDKNILSDYPEEMIEKYIITGNMFSDDIEVTAPYGSDMGSKFISIDVDNVEIPVYAITEANGKVTIEEADYEGWDKPILDKIEIPEYDDIEEEDWEDDYFTDMVPDEE